MKHLRAVNSKAARVERVVRGDQAGGSPSRSATTALGAAASSPGMADDADVVALQRAPSPPDAAPHIPLGCSTVFSPGWEADRTGGTAGLCQPVERDLFDCHVGCYWPAQVPDQLNHTPDWTSTCAAAQKDWRKIDLIFP